MLLFDYLLKPIDIEELKLAVLKSNSQNRNTEKKLEVLDQNLHGKIILNKIAIPSLDGLLFLMLLILYTLKPIATIRPSTLLIALNSLQVKL